MPLYKLTERRLKRKERDDEAGLTELKAALREEMGDEGETDDDESDSESDSDSSEEEGEGDEEDDGQDGIAGPSGTSSTGEEDDADGADLSEIDLDDLEENEDVDDEGEGIDEEDEDAGPPPMSLNQALTSPIYPNRQTPTSRRKGPSSVCVLCPGKVLQSEKVVGEHLASLVHQRALKRYKARLDHKVPIDTEDPREVVATIFAEIGNTQKRPEKKAKNVKDGKPRENVKAGAMPISSADREKAKRQKTSREERRKNKAQALINRIDAPKGSAATTAPDVVANVAGEAGDKEGGAVKLNRKARRLLAGKGRPDDAGSAASKGTNPKSQGENGKGKELKTVQGEEEAVKKAKKPQKKKKVALDA